VNKGKKRKGWELSPSPLEAALPQQEEDDATPTSPALTLEEALA